MSQFGSFGCRCSEREYFRRNFTNEDMDLNASFGALLSVIALFSCLLSFGKSQV